MNHVGWKWIGVLAAVAVLQLTVGGADAQSGSVTIQWGEPAAPAPPPQAPPQVKKGGPPPHAPAHGYRAKHQYRYYPCCRTYYDPDRRSWFYLSSGEWTVGASIPGSLQAQLGAYVNISLDTDNPYEHNDEHQREYPAGKYKKNK